MLAPKRQQRTAAVCRVSSAPYTYVGAGGDRTDAAKEALALARMGDADGALSMFKQALQEGGCSDARSGPPVVLNQVLAALGDADHLDAMLVAYGAMHQTPAVTPTVVTYSTETNTIHDIVELNV